MDKGLNFVDIQWNSVDKCQNSEDKLTDFVDKINFLDQRQQAWKNTGK